jgi:outer membrane lipoprotein carrier protein
MRALACTVAAAIALHAGAAAAQKPDAVVKSVQAFYKSKKHATITFRQTYTNATFGKADPTQDGTLYIKKPGKMRWDYYRKQKPTKHVISNGKKLWVIDRGNKEVVVKKLDKSNLPSAITFLYGKGDLLKDYSAAISTAGTYGANGDIVLDLTPNAASAQVAELFLVVDPTDYHVKESVIVDSAKNTNHFEFDAADYDASIADTTFKVGKKLLSKYRIVTD